MTDDDDHEDHDDNSSADAGTLCDRTVGQL